jgi:hypothetical protein
MPSPKTSLTEPSYRRTAAIITRSTGSKCLRTSSGSSFSMKLVEPRMSANKTVTLLRSPSMKRRDASMRSATLSAGTAEAAGVGAAALAPSPSRTPHFLQNFAPVRLLSPHCPQLALNGAPHSSQNCASAALVC